MVNNAVSEGSNIQEEVSNKHKPGKVMISLGPTSRWHRHHAMFQVNSNKPAYKVIFSKLQKKNWKESTKIKLSLINIKEHYYLSIGVQIWVKSRDAIKI